MVKLTSNKIFKAIDPVKASKSDKTNTNKGTEPKKNLRKRKRLIKIQPEYSC